MYKSNNADTFSEILIVEDDKIIALLQKRLIEAVMGRKPVLLSNGRLAIEYLNQSAKKGMKDSLVLLDLNMPIMDGWEFLKHCERKPYLHNVHIIIVTSSLCQEDHEKAKSIEKILDFYTKPLKKEKLEEIMRIKQLTHFFQSKTILKNHL
ncbi:response regulator [Salegentibacter sp.]|uniref:response regulator n=1 Tax=Salegentibacter sp. TaxID=1903072 RepID=UPI003569CEEE